MNEAFSVALWRTLLNSTSIFDAVFNQIRKTSDQSWRKVSGEEERGRVGGISHGYVTIGIDDLMVVQNVVRYYERAQDRFWW